jgi:hypothetical protein
VARVDVASVCRYLDGVDETLAQSLEVLRQLLIEEDEDNDMHKEVGNNTYE